jgi:hypothetical protein
MLADQKTSYPALQTNNCLQACSHWACGAQGGRKFDFPALRNELLVWSLLPTHPILFNVLNQLGLP